MHKGGLLKHLRGPDVKVSGIMTPHSMHIGTDSDFDKDPALASLISRLNVHGQLQHLLPLSAPVPPFR